MANDLSNMKFISTINSDISRILGKRSTPHKCETELDSSRSSKRPCTEGIVKATNTPNATAPSEPWHHNDPYLSLLSPSVFFAQITPSAPFPLTDTCPIHPIFHFFSGLTPHIPLLLPALRLATRLLTSRHTLPFIHNLMTAQATQLEEESSFYGKLILHLPESKYKDTGLPPREHQLTVKALLALSEHIEIAFGADPRLNDRTWAFTTRAMPPQYPTSSLNPKHQRATSRYALPLPRPWQLTPSQISLLPPALLTQRQRLLRSQYFRGTKARVHLSSTFLRRLHSDTYPPVNDATKLRAMFFLADTLIHEVVHGIWMCRMPPPMSLDGECECEWLIDLSGANEYEVFVGGERKAELGYAFESSVWGGGVVVPLGQDAVSRGEARVRDFEMGLGLLAWPDAGEFFVQSAQYANPVPLARLSAEVGEDGRRKVLTGGRWDEMRVVGHEWIARMFRAEFWKGIEEGGGRGLLEVGREVSCRRENADRGCVEGGVAVDWEGEEGWDADEDESGDFCTES